MKYRWAIFEVLMNVEQHSSEYFYKQPGQEQWEDAARAWSIFFFSAFYKLASCKVIRTSDLLSTLPALSLCFVLVLFFFSIRIQMVWKNACCVLV